MIKTEALLQETALHIVDTLLFGFKRLCSNVHVRPSEYCDCNFPRLTAITCRSNKRIEISTEQKSNGEESFFQVQPNHVYRLIWYNRLFFVAFYTSPEVYGYYSALPDFDITPYMFCSIIEMHNRFHKKYEMNFGFNPENQTFLELFDVEYHILDDFVRECRDTDSIERELRGKVLF